MFREEGEILANLLGMGLQGIEHVAAAIRVGESGIVLRMVVMFVKAWTWRLSAQLVIKASIWP